LATTLFLPAVLPVEPLSWTAPLEITRAAATMLEKFVADARRLRAAA
jgi:hypothetical protein